MKKRCLKHVCCTPRNQAPRGVEKSSCSEQCTIYYREDRICEHSSLTAFKQLPSSGDNPEIIIYTCNDYLFFIDQLVITLSNNIQTSYKPSFLINQLSVQWFYLFHQSFMLYHDLYNLRYLLRIFIHTNINNLFSQFVI